MKNVARYAASLVIYSIIRGAFAFSESAFWVIDMAALVKWLTEEAEFYFDLLPAHAEQATACICIG